MEIQKSSLLRVYLSLHDNQVRYEDFERWLAATGISLEELKRLAAGPIQ